MVKKYVVRLTDTEREILEAVLKHKRVAAREARHRRMLLRDDANGPDWTDAEIAEAFDRRTQSVGRLRERLVTEGSEVTLHGKPKSRVRGKVLHGEREARIIAPRLGLPPRGFAIRTLRLLAERAAASGIAESVSHETPRRALKKAG